MVRVECTCSHHVCAVPRLIIIYNSCCSSLSRPDVPVAKLRLMLKGENLEDERSAQDYHIRRDEVLTLILKEPDGNAAQTAQVLRDGVNPHTSHMCNGCAD